jgi:hypothetical protein
MARSASKSLKCLAVLVVVILLGSCATLVPPISTGELAVLRRGMSARDVTVALNEKAPRYSFSMSINGEPYRVDSYVLNVGGYRSDYFLAYESGMLMFWGYPHEFARSKNETINQLGKKGVGELRKHQGSRCEGAPKRSGQRLESCGGTGTCEQ